MGGDGETVAGIALASDLMKLASAPVDWKSPDGPEYIMPKDPQVLNTGINEVKTTCSRFISFVSEVLYLLNSLVVFHCYSK